MKLEQQVCGLELAKKLKELGVKNGSYFSWYKDVTRNKDWTVVKSMFKVSEHLESAVVKNGQIYQAFTVAELGEMLPHRIGEYDLRFWAVQFAGSHHKYVGYLKDSDDGSHFMNSQKDGMGNNVAVFADTEADARAKCLIYLLEHRDVIAIN